MITYLTATIGGELYFRWAYEALLTGVIQLHENVSVKFHGDVIPQVKKFAGFVELTWNDKVEILVPGPIDPDVKLIRLRPNSITIELVMGGNVQINIEDK